MRVHYRRNTLYVLCMKNFYNKINLKPNKENSFINHVFNKIYCAKYAHSVNIINNNEVLQYKSGYSKL